MAIGSGQVVEYSVWLELRVLECGDTAVALNWIMVAQDSYVPELAV
jgi:hypothetical protein